MKKFLCTLGAIVSALAGIVMLFVGEYGAAAGFECAVILWLIYDDMEG
jgi:hypothetical protein